MRRLAIPEELVAVGWFCTRFGHRAHLKGESRVGFTGRKASHSLCGRFLSDEVDSPSDGFKNAPRNVWKPCSVCLQMYAATVTSPAPCECCEGPGATFRQATDCMVCDQCVAMLQEIAAAASKPQVSDPPQRGAT